MTNPPANTADAANANRLASETSPYLLQHKDNPVHWQPWSHDIFARARAENKPILLSVGYSACHWCHVMAHESFESPDIAEQMNRLFINVKVDREERPDVDALYQSALSLLGEQGGWPLTMFLTPNGDPFWGGTYFPPEDRYGRPGFPAVLSRISEIFHHEPDKIGHNVDALRTALADLSDHQPGHNITPAIQDQIADQFFRLMDMEHGGLGGAPKFPQPAVLDYLWRASYRTGDRDYKEAVLLTLRKMSQGGIYDHIGGGYARYATDLYWLVPHFEKMLYDNAQLLPLLARAWLATGDDLFQLRLEETIDWMVRELRQPGGGFASAIDADSEGEEGRFTVWDAAEIDTILGTDPTSTLFKKIYNVSAQGNWEGKTILNRTAHPAMLSDAEEAALKTCRERLRHVRDKRPRPGLDDKILTDWNALAIHGLACAGQLLKRPDWIALAIEAERFISETLWQDDTHLFHSYRNGQAKHAGTLDDYVQLAAASLSLFATTNSARYLEQTQKLADIIDQRFRDPQKGGCFLSDQEQSDLPMRTKPIHDNATPSGNGALIHVLSSLYYYTGDETYRTRAEALIRHFAGALEHQPLAVPMLASGIEALEATIQILITGPDPEHMVAAALTTADPRLLVRQIDATMPLPEDHPAAGKTTIDGKPTAYICRGPVCSLPITDPEMLKRELDV